MLYNKRKNGFQDSNNNIDILDKIYNLKKYDEYTQMNQFLVPPLFDYNNIYNSYNEFKKKHDKDYLLFGNNKSKRKSKEIKDKKEEINENDKYNDINNNNNRIIKKRKLCKYNILSIPGSHKGMEKINQDVSLLLQNINDCKNIKLFGVFDGHGNYGELLSKEISEYFSTFFSNKKLYEEIKDKTDNDNNENSMNINKRNKIKIKIEKYNFKTEVKQNDENETDKNNSKQKKSKLNIKTKFNKFNELNHNKRNSLLFSKFKNIKSMISNKISKNKKIKNAYDILSSNNYSHIYNSFNAIDKILHDKYNINKICHGSGVALSFLILFNDHYLDNNINDKNKSYKNYNKIISTNLGNTKTILISDDKKIKELNICHTPCVKEERLRIENNGGKIGKIDWLKVGPLRVWFKDKKYPGLSITRSLGDFEAEQLGILSIPDIKEFDVDEEKIKIIVMGTNGIWEFLTNDKIMDIVLGYYECEDANGATQKIIETAGKLWKIKNPNNIPDLTVVVLFFK
jgi:serine/threonine protein phosphatase PrpC